MAKCIAWQDWYFNLHDIRVLPAYENTPEYKQMAYDHSPAGKRERNGMMPMLDLMRDRAALRREDQRIADGDVYL